MFKGLLFRIIVGRRSSRQSTATCTKHRSSGGGVAVFVVMVVYFRLLGFQSYCATESISLESVVACLSEVSHQNGLHCAAT